MSSARHQVWSRPLGRWAAVLVGVVALVTAGCGQASAPSGGGSGSTPSGSAVPGGKITVLAAASLTGTFTQLGKDFQAAHPGTTVTFSFGSSATLATQVTQGAPADVFAAANEKTMQTVSSAGLTVGQPKPFVTNTLEIAVPKGNPGRITGLKDFADADKKIALCAQQVPCGSAAVQVFTDAGITPKPDSYEQDVKAALQKVANDEVDAALVYKTDVIAADGSVEGLEFPEAAKAVNVYPIATLTSSKNAATASGFVDYVLSEQGQAVLTKAGFGQP